MTALALLVEADATPSSVTATLDLFRIAARFDPDARITVEPFSARGGALSLAAGLTLDTRPLPPSLADYTAVILPGFFAADPAELMERVARDWRPAISRLRGLGPETLVAASCYGTFVLAESGLLDGRKATTTWWLRQEFAGRYPRVRLDADQALVDAGSVLTAGAMTAHTELSLHLLRRLRGQALARRVGSVMLVDESRSSQRPFMALPRRFGDPLVGAAVARMEGDLAAPFSAAGLARELNVSYRTLHRRFRAAAGMSPLGYLQALRVECAKELLEEGGGGIDQIAAAVGYGDPPSFRRLFARLVGITPASYRRRFRGPGKG